MLPRLVRESLISVQRAEQALEDFLNMRVTHYPHTILLPRIWQLRDNLSAYDGAYVVLAEKLNAPLISRNSRLGTAPGHTAQIELF